jgi:hypothetical protein
MFETYGPFPIEKDAHNKDGIDRLYHEGFGRDVTKNIENGIGVYVVASENADGTLVPRYVGRTEDTFGGRLKRHFDKGKFFGLVGESRVQIFLIARAIDGCIVTKEEATEKDGLLIQQLELDLIDHCAKLVDEKLLNVQNRKKREVYVAGYRGDSPSKREPAAKVLGIMLQT